MSESFLDIKHATTAVNHVTQINNSDGEQKILVNTGQNKMDTRNLK